MYNVSISLDGYQKGHSTCQYRGKQSGKPQIAAPDNSSTDTQCYPAPPAYVEVNISRHDSLARPSPCAGIAVTGAIRQLAQLRAAWMPCSLCVRLRSFHTSTIPRSDRPETPPQAEAASPRSPRWAARSSTAEPAVMQAGTEPIAEEEEGMFHMPQHPEDAEFEGQDVPVMDVPGSRPHKPNLVEQYLSEVRPCPHQSPHKHSQYPSSRLCSFFSSSCQGILPCLPSLSPSLSPPCKPRISTWVALVSNTM